MKDVVIFGTEAVAQEVYYCLTHFSSHVVAGFTCDASYLKQNKLFDLPVIPFEDVEDAFPPSSHRIMVAIGYIKNNKIRSDRFSEVRQKGYETLNFVSPNAVIYPNVVIGTNCFIGHLTTISPNVVIGDNVFIGNGCNIGHDCVISDHCYLSNSVSVSGRVKIRSHTYIATNATIRNKVEIGSKSVIGAGATVLQSCDDKSVFLGEPAKILPIKSDKLPLA